MEHHGHDPASALGLGPQRTQPIASRIREQGGRCTLRPCTDTASDGGRVRSTRPHGALLKRTLARVLSGVQGTRCVSHHIPRKPPATIGWA